VNSIVCACVLLCRILRHFNTSSDEYSVIFVSNSTAALRLVAESFQFIESLPQPERKAADCKEFLTRYQHNEEVLRHKSFEEYHNICDASTSVSDAKPSVCNNSNDSPAADDDDDEDDDDEDDDEDGGCDIDLHSEPPISCCEWNCEPILKPTFLYLDDNHTSVIGMRGVIADHGAQFCCIQPDKMDAFLSSLQQPSNVKPLSSQSVTTHSPLSHDRPRYIINSLFAYPAQSNFSGFRYPLAWVNTVRCEPVTASETCPQSKCRTHPHSECRTHPHRECRMLPRWYVLLDAAALLTTSTLDLTLYKPDFVVLSFYKMFGFPTGLGM